MGSSSSTAHTAEHVAVQETVNAEASARGLTPEDLYRLQNGLAAPSPYSYAATSGARMFTPREIAQRSWEGHEVSALPFQMHPMAAMPVAPQVQQRAYTISNPVHLAKSSLTVRPDDDDPSRLEVSFVVDATAPCAVTVYFGVHEQCDGESLTVKYYAPVEYTATRVVLPPGMGQRFPPAGVPAPVFPTTTFPSDHVFAPADSAALPIVVVLEAAAEADVGTQERITVSREGVDVSSRRELQSQTTYATLTPGSDPSTPPTAKVLRQKLQVKGRALMLKELYGIDGSAPKDPSSPSPGEDPGGADCVVCLTEKRDTAVLPCRHMCLCKDCAEQLRMQTNKCPICRSAVTSLLHISVDDEPDDVEDEGSGGSGAAAPAPTSSSPPSVQPVV